MSRTAYSYPARLEPDEEGRLVVHFPDLPEALTDGADVTEVLTEASDCLSTALAARIVNGEDIPPPSRLRPRQHLVAPEAAMAMKAALYSALRAREMSAADLARQLRIDERKATRLIDPRASSSLTSLEAALSALGYAIGIEVHEKPAGNRKILGPRSKD
jgi:antitoxin HicB